MASYVIVNTKIGKWLTFYPWGEVTTKSEAMRIAKDFNEDEKVSYYKAMPEMEYYRTYEPEMYAFVIACEKKEAAAKAKRKRDREAKKALEEQKLAAAKAWWADDRNFA
jgi:hypothetical protein